MIELIQVHDLGGAMEDGRTTINIPIAANILTKNTVALRRNFAGVKQRRRDITANCNGEKLKVNVTFGNPDSDLKNRKITFQEYADMKTNYDNRMVTEYEKEGAKIAPSTEPPPLSYTDERGILWRLIGEIPNEHGGKLGRYAPVFSETVAPKPLPWSQRFFRFFGRR